MGFCLLNSVAIARLTQILSKLSCCNTDFDVTVTAPLISAKIIEIHVCSSMAPFTLIDYDLNRPNIVNAFARDQGKEFRKKLNAHGFLRSKTSTELSLYGGFDAHQQDPLSEISLTEDDFYWITREIVFRSNILTAALFRY